jgi:ketosteroid isomerase-like protein
MRGYTIVTRILLGQLAAVVTLAVAVQAAGHAADQGAQQQVYAAEREFAKSMADRNRAAFASFVSDEAVFFGGPAPLRGKAAVVEGWSGFFDGAEAPFSWEPDQVEVLQTGDLALSTGLVKDPHGRVMARFNSIWRLEAPGTWRVVFDKGGPATQAERGLDPTAEQYIVDSERAWAESVASGDTGAIERILADDFVGVDPKGRRYDRKQMVEETRTAPKYFASNRVNDVKVRFFGPDHAVAQGDESWVKHAGDNRCGRFVWTDTWVRRDGRWQIVAAEDLTVPETCKTP